MSKNRRERDDHERCATVASESSPLNVAVTQHSNDSHLGEHTAYPHPAERNSILLPTGLSDRQRPSSLATCLSRRENSSVNGPPTSIDTEDVLPDDSPLTYIGMTLLPSDFNYTYDLLGDKRGPRFFVYDLCYPEAPQDAMPYLLPRQADTSWKPHEVEYLRHQGAFVTLSDDVADALIRCYFQHVHFFLPIVDAASFLTEYENKGRQNISLLLFWSMLLAAANVCQLLYPGVRVLLTLPNLQVCRSRCLTDGRLCVEKSYENRVL